MAIVGITVEGGVGIGGGITLGASGPSLTITSADFTWGSGAGGTTEYITPGGGNLICPFYSMNSSVGSVVTRITDFFTACGYDIDTSYVFHATFASATPSGGSLTTPYQCLVRADWARYSDQFELAVIDQSNPNWTTGIPNQSTQLQGTFTLPVTLTPYTPTTSMGPSNWC
jgi:hypothetical protein